MVPESWPLVSRWPQCWWWHSKDLFSVQYITVDSCIGGIMAWGPGTLMVMLDVAGTYCNVAIHILWISCFWPLGMKWWDKYYVDMVLPFGLWSAWNIFTAIADVVQWMLTSHHGVDFLCLYLDDFFTLGLQASLVYHNNLQVSIQLCSKLGLPLHPDKLEDLSTYLSLLGIEQAWLPTDKREWIIILLETWSGKRFL